MADFQDNQKGDTIQVPPLSIDTPQSDAAIDDIVAQDADRLLAAEDAVAADDQGETSDGPARRGHPVFWFGVALLAAIALAALFLLLHPDSA